MCAKAQTRRKSRAASPAQRRAQQTCTPQLCWPIWPRRRPRVTPELARSISQFRGLRREIVLGRSAGLGRRPRIGFVPTMGALHEGHASLLAQMREDCDVRIASIFVNPLQFAAGEDLDRYPRTLEADLELCAAQGVELVLAPEPAEMYPAGFQTRVQLPGLAQRWCGASRPGHFDGVATVVLKLFELVQPDLAYLGRKDYQQLRIIQQMAADLSLQTEVIGCPIVREADGLALSSRNSYLSEDERAAAPQLSRALEEMRAHFLSGEKDSARLIADGLHKLSWTEGGNPRWQVDYLAIVDPLSLEPVATASEGDVLLAAAWLGRTRLIDNMELGA
ncbi:pantoate--beta-alanine ligase [bacterium]|nr:pantoate--beta-alanine ligase [bacterium]